MQRKIGLIAVSFFILILLSNMIVFANEYGKNIYFDGEKINSDSNIKNVNGEIYIKARFLSELLEADLEWRKSIQLLELEKDNNYAKMMKGNPYLEINNTTRKVANGLVIDNDQAYLPFKKIAEGFGYIFTTDSKSIYVFNAEIMVNKISYDEKNRRLKINLSEETQIDIKKMADNPEKLKILLRRATLSGDFRDELPAEDFGLEIKRTQDKMYLEIIVDSAKNLAFQESESVIKTGNDIYINYLSKLKEITWQDNDGLKIITDDNIIGETKISYLDEPKKMVIDFPHTILNGFKNNFSENRWIENVEVSQFKTNPMVTRVVLELKESSYLTQEKRDNSIIFYPKGQVELSNLEYEDSVISFESNKKLQPKIFTLSEPDRLVVDLPGAFRNYSFSDKTAKKDEVVKKVRTSRFNSDVVRLVADLNKQVNYNWSTEKNGEGYLNKIYLNNNIRKIEIGDQKGYNEIRISFNNKLDYEVKKRESPERLVVDVRGLENYNRKLDLPEKKGVVKKVDFGPYDKDVVRFEFLLENYYGHVVNSDNQAKNISIKLWKTRREKEKEDLSDLIVLDPGHGGFDPGAIGGNGLQEKEVNLDLALLVRDKLTKKGYNVLLTRQTDEYVSLQRRVEIAREKKARIFVSIHNNSSRKSHTGGSEIYVSQNYKKEDMQLAQLINDNLCDEIKLDDRGLKQDNFYVIKNTIMPSVLLEVAFLSNPHEEKLLGSNVFLNKAANGIVDGILDFLEKDRLEAE